MAKQITGTDADKVLTEEDRKRLIEEVTTPILKEAEERMIEGVRTRKPVKPLTRQEQIEATPEGEIPQRLRPGKPTSDKIEIPTTLPDHGIRSLYSDSELILERATSITGLPPESPANHYIAQTLAKGDPFSAKAMDNAKEETMKLVRAGVIPNPDYEGFGGFVSQAVDVVGPMAVEIGGPMFTGIVSSPLLLAPEPVTKALWVGLQGTSSAFFNIVAQQMRIGSGMQEDTSYMEAVAAGGFGLIPGLKTGKDLSTAATVVVRGAQGAGMGVGEDLTRQGLQVLFEEREGIDLEETLIAGGVGAGFGASLGATLETKWLDTLDEALISYSPKKDPSAPILRKVLQDELKQVKKELQRTEKRGAVNKAARDKVKKIEDKINALKPDEERVLQQAVDALDEAEQKQAQEVAKAANEFQQSEAARVLKESDVQAKEQLAPKPTEAPTPKPQEEVSADAREIVEDFLTGGGTRGIDPETGKPKDTKDEIKARLLTDDTEKQRLINSVQDAIKSDLEKVKGGRVGKVQYLVKVQQELDSRLGKEAGNELALVMRASQVTDNAEVADAIDQLGIHMAANGAIMVKGFDDVIKFLDGADLNNPEVINDAMVSIHKLIPAMMGWKKSGTASGRLLQSRKYTKDVLEIKQEHLKEKLEGNLVSDLKAAKDLTTEQLDQQIKTFGEIEVVKKLLQAVQQADDISEVRDILVKQQEAFQSKSAKEVARKLVNDPYSPNEKGTASVYTKGRDVGNDLLYASMLSSPVTHAKVAISNRLMSSYHRLAGFVGAKYMATVPWARNGLTREQFEEAGEFWLRASTSYGNFSEIANKEALRVLKTGDSDLQSHFERIGESAFSMERTGITGALGQSIENVGRFVDIPGKAMAAIDVRTRLNIAHSMTLAKAEMDYIAAKKAGKPVGEFQDFYNNFVSKVFTESKTKLLNEDQVRRKAILMAEKEGVKPEDLASYIDNFVKDNWNKDTSAFVDYVNRNLKEVTFTEEIGEFADAGWMQRVQEGRTVVGDPNVMERGSRHIEAFLNTYPLLKTVLNPFMRTGRNITRGAMASTNSLVSLADLITKTKIPGTKAAHETAKKLWSKTAKDLESDDPVVAARAKGQQIIGAGVILAAYGLAEGVEDVFEFVGTESQDWKTKMNIRAATGMPEYTLRIGKEGEKQAISLAALEPLNTILGITADFKTLHHGTVAQREEARNLMEAAALAITNNITNKSYYKNLGDAIKLVTQATDSKEATQREGWRILKGLGSAVVPSIANTANYMSDDVVRENNNLLQVIARRMNGLSKLVPPMRDIFGDVQERGIKKRKVGGLATLLPFATFNQKGSIKKYVKVDPDTGFRTLDIPKITRTTVRKELKDKGTKNITKELVEEAYQAKISEAAAAVVVELGGTHHFNGGTSIWEKMDLEEIIHEETQQNAFDRWQELSSQVKLSNGIPSKTGKTLKEQIISSASRADFKIRKAPKTALPEGFEEYDDRPATVSDIFRDYRNAALEQLKEEYPILVEQVEFKQELTERLAEPVREGELEERRRLEQALPGTEFPLESYKKTQRPSKLEERLIPFRN